MFPRFFLLLLIALLTHSCATSSVREALRFPNSTEAEQDFQARYQPAATALAAEFHALQPLVSHEKHFPRLYLHGGPTETVVVLVHGLYESPFYLKGIARFLHSQGSNVITPLLARHWAVPLEDLDNADYREWLDQYLEIVKRAHSLGKRVILAGHSTGGLLAVYTAIQHPELVHGLLLWSPALALNYKSYYGSWAGALLKGRVNLDFNKLAGKPPKDPEKVAYYAPAAGNEVAKLEAFLLEDYARSHPFSSRPSWWVKKSAYAAIRVPVFLVNPEVDEIVSTKEMDYFYSALDGPKEHLVLKGENHTSTCKGPDDFVEGVQRANLRFPAMLERLGAFFNEHFSPAAGRVGQERAP